MKLRKSIAMAVMLLFLLQSGCGASAPPSAEVPPEESAPLPPAAQRPNGGLPEDRQLYTIQLDGRDSITFNADGEEVPSETFEILYDLVTGEPQCRKKTILEDTGRDDEGGGPILRKTVALFDLDGKILHDYEETDYQAGFGDFLIRGVLYDWNWEDAAEQDPNRTELWNYKTGETVLPGVGYAEPMDPEGSSFMMLDANSQLLGIANRDGTVASGFPPPEPYEYSSVWNGGIITSGPTGSGGQKPRSVWINKALEPVLTYDSMNGGFYGLRGNFALFEDGSRKGILDGQGQECYQIPEGYSVEYFDGELVVLSEEDWRTDGMRYRLEKADGTELAAGYSRLEVGEDQYDKAPAEYFVGLRDKRVIEKLGLDGTVLCSSAELPEVSYWNQIDGGFISCQLDQGGAVLLGKDLQVLIGPGKYTSINQLRCRDQNQWMSSGLLECSYTVGGEGSMPLDRRDILDASLNKLAGGLTSVQGVGPNRLAVIRGFSAGLMDWDGNWIVQKSIFQSLNEENDMWW